MILVIKWGESESWDLTCFCFPSKACSLKCYKCATSSEKECERNQTLSVCEGASFHCATAMFSQVGFDGSILSQTYMKRCLPLAVITCDIFNKSGNLHNCSVSSCDVDYCNGPTPTTPTVRTEVTTITSEGTSQEPGSTPKKPVARAGGLSTISRSSTFVYTMTVFALGKILEICSASWDNPSKMYLPGCSCCIAYIHCSQ